MSFQTPPHTLSLSPTGTERKTGNLQAKKTQFACHSSGPKGMASVNQKHGKIGKKPQVKVNLEYFYAKKINQFSCIKNPKPTEISREFPSANIRRLRHRRRLAEFFSMRIKKSGRDSIRENCPREAFNLPLNYRLLI